MFCGTDEAEPPLGCAAGSCEDEASEEMVTPFCSASTSPGSVKSSVWGRDYDGELKIVDVNIRRLRIKIEDDTANPTYITTVWGFGYKWGV